MSAASPWCNPPPPGIEMDDESRHSHESSSHGYTVMDQLDPYIKNPEYVRYRRGTAPRRSRSRSYDHHRRSTSTSRRRRHRSRSRHKRSRSRSRHRRHRRQSGSRSRSRSGSPSRRHRHKRSSRKSRRSRSRSRSHERRRAERKSYEARRSPPVENNGNESKGEEDEVDAKENAFKNDGSFLEMFKKMQEEKLKAEAEKANPVAPAPAAGTSEPKRLLPAFGKRRGGRVLKTGMVEKTKVVEDDELANATDPWSIYLKEVKRYKEACCDDDSKTRPLVK